VPFIALKIRKEKKKKGPGAPRMVVPREVFHRKKKKEGDQAPWGGKGTDFRTHRGKKEGSATSAYEPNRSSARRKGRGRRERRNKRLQTRGFNAPMSR